MVTRGAFLQTPCLEASRRENLLLRAHYSVVNHMQHLLQRAHCSEASRSQHLLLCLLRQLLHQLLHQLLLLLHQLLLLLLLCLPKALLQSCPVFLASQRSLRLVTR